MGAALWLFLADEQGVEPVPMTAKNVCSSLVIFVLMGENSPFGLMLRVLQYWCRGDLAALLNQWVNTVNTVNCKL
jgi:membrane protein insertase Oxa1/YidC/SpoIIIJ